jgi:hypothetical protein
MFGSQIAKCALDILKGVNEAEKVGKIVKTGISGADILVGTSHALEDFGCNDYVYGSLDIIGSVSSAVGMVLGNIPSTKSLTFITGSVTVGCRSVRYYCKRYVTFWGCTVASGQGVKTGLKFLIKN